MVAFVTTSDCFADPFCDNLGVAWSALTVGAVVFTVVFTGYLVWTLFGKAADELWRAASIATMTACVVGAAWGLIWLADLLNPLALIFPIASLVPLLARSASNRTFLFVVAVTLVILGVSALALFFWYLPAAILQSGLLAFAVWARRRASHRPSMASNSAVTS